MKRTISSIPEYVSEYDPHVRNLPEWVVGIYEQPEASEINTLDNLLLEVSAGDFWVLKDLRRDRRYVYEKEFLFGLPLLEFNKRLAKSTRPLFPRKYFRKFNEKLFLENQASD